MVTSYEGSGEPLQPNTVSPRIFKFLKRYVDRLLPHERIVVLTFNEFAFRDFVPMTKEGYSNGEKLPSHLVVPCIRFVVSKKFHFLGSLFFHADYLTMKPDKFSKDMSECIKLYILALQNINLKVVATVCPLSASFHQAVVILTQVPYLEDYDGALFYSIGKNKEIVHFHDPKYVRDSFIRWFMLFDLEFTLNGKRFEASRYDISDGLQHENKPPFLQKSNNNSKYYDQISIYYFNEKMSVTIRKLIKQGYLSSNAIGTSLFINMFRQIFNRLYGLNDEDCDKFDFSRVNEYIDFILSVRATQPPFNDNCNQEITSNLPSTSTSKSNSELIALEKFVKDTPSTSQVLYPQTEKPLDVLKNDNKFESVIVPTASSKNIPPTVPALSHKGSKKKKKKKDKKKQNESYEYSMQSNKHNEIKDDKSNVKDDLLLLYQNPSEDVEDNGEFVLCTTKKYQEIQAQKAISSDHSYAMPSEENDGLDKNFWFYQMLQTNASNQQDGTNVPNNKHYQQYNKKVLSPVQNLAEMNVNKNVNQRAVQNSNLNENIRKYKNVNKTSSAVRKINLDDESNKENITKSFRSTKYEDTFNVSTTKREMLELNEKIPEISYSISDPDNSTEYQFEQLNTRDDRIDQIVRNQSEISDDICKVAMNILQTYLTKDQVRALLEPESCLENSERFKELMSYLKDQNPQYGGMENDELGLTELLQQDFVTNTAETNEKNEELSTDSVHQSTLDSKQKETVHEEMRLFSAENIFQLDNMPGMNLKVNLIKICPEGTNSEANEKINIKVVTEHPPEDFSTNTVKTDVESTSETINLLSGMNIVQLDNIPSGNIKMNIVKVSPDGDDERIDFKLINNEDARKPTKRFHHDDKVNKPFDSETSLSSIYSELNAKMDSLKISIENINNEYDELPASDSLSYSEQNQSVHNEPNLQAEFDTLGVDNVPIENTKMTLLKIGPSGIERARGDISEYDPLKINKNYLMTGQTYSKERAIDIPHLVQDNYTTFADRLEPELKSEKINSATSELCTENQSFSNITSYYHDNISQEITENFPYSSNMELLADTSVNLATYAEVLSDSLNNSSKTSSFHTAVPVDSIKNSRYSKRYPQYQEAFNTDTDDILSGLDLYEDYKIKSADDMQTQHTFSNEQCASSDFNSEYDDFDEIIMNKQVTKIINKLEEKDEQISRTEDQIKFLAPSTSREHLSKKSLSKKKISFPSDENFESGVGKRTVFQRDKTEQYTATPKNVIKNSENICDKSKIASTKASYSKTLGLKKKKQLERMREEQYKKVANTISQTIRNFSDIFNLPGTNEEKSLRISKASLEFVYDLKHVNEVTDVKKKQRLVDAAYDKLCLSILGNHLNNPKVHTKMKELMPLLQEIAAPDQESTDDASSKLLSEYINKASFSKEIPKGNSQIGETRYVREDVPNLWINNIKGMEKLFRRLGAEKVYFELSPDLFKTEHVVHMMNFIQANGPAIESFPLDERCLPVDLGECFDTLKPYGSVLLVED